MVDELIANVTCSLEFRDIFAGAEVPMGVINQDVRRALVELDVDMAVGQRRMSVVFDLTAGSCVCRLYTNETVPVFEEGHAWQTYAVRPASFEELPSLAWDARRTLEMHRRRSENQP